MKKKLTICVVSFIVILMGFVAVELAKIERNGCWTRDEQWRTAFCCDRINGCRRDLVSARCGWTGADISNGCCGCCD